MMAGKFNSKGISLRGRGCRSNPIHKSAISPSYRVRLLTYYPQYLYMRLGKYSCVFRGLGDVCPRVIILAEWSKRFKVALISWLIFFPRFYYPAGTPRVVSDNHAGRVGFVQNYRVLALSVYVLDDIIFIWARTFQFVLFAWSNIEKVMWLT